MNEEFEKWLKHDCPVSVRLYCDKQDIEKIFFAGAEVQKNKILTLVDEYEANKYGVTGMADAIRQTIEKGE